VVDISAAAGLAGGYYVNMARDVIFQSGGALAQGGLKHFYVIRLDDILNREDNEKRLRDILARATGEAHDNAADYKRNFERPTSATGRSGLPSPAMRSSTCRPRSIRCSMRRATSACRIAWAATTPRRGGCASV